MHWAEIDPVDLWPLVAAARSDPWRSVGRLLGEELAERAGRQPGPPVVVLAYSFGARLALGIDGLDSGGLPIAACCMVSCNPGLAEDDLEGREARRLSDERWARMFMEASESEIREAWEAQPVLADSARSVRPAALPAPRYALAVAMRRLSLSRQPDFRGRLARWRTPLLWVTGEKDEKFTRIARQLEAEGVPAGFLVCPSAGHRVPWDNPGRFSSMLREWLMLIGLG
jgi:2-succinyl-6-hydroxy-2,4-cyclohexadiene-1-carboxylate synthase